MSFEGEIARGKRKEENCERKRKRKERKRTSFYFVFCTALHSG
jgi:hypothetical protein